MKKSTRQLVLETLENRWNPAGIGVVGGLESFTGQEEGIVFVDSHLVDSLPAEELAGAKVVVVEGGRDAVSQISDGLYGLNGVSVVRFISHGTDGAIWFGDQKIDSGTLASRSSEIASWSGHLAKGADLLVYGCSVASTSEGKRFVADLARLTGADVAASDDITGSSGDLNLEFAVGVVNQSLISKQSDWERNHLQLENLVKNGDFELGNVGFGTQYVYSAGDIGPAQSYDVLTDPKLGRPRDINPVSYKDHTTGQGLMMAVNGGVQAGQAVWKQKVTVLPQSDYSFSMWVSSWFGTNPAKLDIQFNGVSVGKPSAPGQVAKWEEFKTGWNSGNSTELEIVIFETGLADIGSDFALDDISLMQSNLITNGDFELGNVGFGTQYVYSAGDIGPAQSYDVLTDPKLGRPRDINPVSYKDHTTGQGLMMAVNGGVQAGQAVWKQKVTVLPQSDYSFSIWVSSWFGTNPAKLDIQFNGVSVGKPSAPGQVAKWEEFKTVWNSGNSTELEIVIFETGLADIGSDFALDDISLIRVDEANVNKNLPGKRIGSYVTYFAGNGSQFPNLNAFTTLLPDGSLASWGAAGSGGSGAPNVKGFSRVFSNSTAFAAIKNDGTVVSWGDPTYGGSGAPGGSGFVEVASTLNSFTALRSDGSVAAWGDLGYYGSPFDPPPTDKGYVSLFSNRWSYAALKADGSINSWGYGGTGGGVGGRPVGTGYKNIFSNVNAFVAMGEDGSLHSWGDWMHGGTGAPVGSGYILVVPCHLAFAALNKDGSVASWGRYAAGSDAPKDKGYVNIFANNSTFVAMKGDGSLTAWGDEITGVPAGPGFVHVSSTMSAFAALRDDGTIHCWGNAAFGGSGGPAGSGFIKVYSTGTAFAALNKDGSISAWGDPANGGSGAPVGNDFVRVLPNYGAFTAIRKNGTVVSWGNNGNGAAGYPSNIPVDHVQSVFEDSESIAKKAPQFVSSSQATFYSGVSGSFQVLATGNPTPTFSLVSGILPSGVTLTSSGLLSGTPANGTGGIHEFTIRATNGLSPDAAQAFTLTVNQAPAITSSDNATFQAGSLGNFSIIATGYPAPAFSVTSGSLPDGVSLSPSGVLSGSPASGTGGVYKFTIQAANGVSPNASQTFTLTVNQAPAITSPDHAVFSELSPGTFQILATGFPARAYSIVAGALPSGLVFDGIKGVISGTPSAGSAGTYTLTVSASNGISPDASQTLALAVNPLFTNFVFNGDFELGNKGFETDYHFSPGVKFDPQTYDVVSDPALSRKDTPVPSYGDHTTGAGLMMALNGATVDGPLVWKQTVGVTPNTSYVFSMWVSSWWNTNLANLEVRFNGQSVGKTVAPSAAGIWEQFRVNWNSGMVTSVTIEIIDRQLSHGGNDFAIDDISLGIPAVPELPDRDLILNPLDFQVGLSGQAELGVVGLPKPVVTVVSGGLPEGLKLTPGGQIIGKPKPGTGGLYKVPVRVSNGVGDQVQTLVGIRVSESPNLVSQIPNLIEGQDVSIQIHQGGYPLPDYSVMAGELPEGLALSPSGILSGKLGFDSRGEYSFTVRASNGVGSPVVLPINLKVGESPTKPGVFAVAASGGAEISTLVIYANGTGEKVREVDPFPGFKGEVFVDSGDVNDDGIEDIIVGSGNGSRNGHVVVFDGKRLLDPNSKAENSYAAGGSVRASLYAFVGYSSGVAVRMADINDDGFDDIIMAPGTSAGMVTQSHLRVWDGKGAMKDFEAGKPLPYDYRWELASFWAFGGTNAPGGGLSISVIRQDGPDLIVASQLFRGGSKVFRYDGTKVLTVEQDLTGNLYLWGSGNTVVGFLLEGQQFYATAGTGRSTPDTVYVRNGEGEVQYRIDRVFDGSPGGLRLGLANLDEDPEEELLVVRDYDSSTRAYDLFADKATLLETLLPGGVSGWV